MGAAKNRGPYEVRKAEGELKRLKEEQSRIHQRMEYEASLTPEQKASRHKTRMLLTTMAGLSAGALV